MLKYIDIGGEDKKEVLLLLHGLGQKKESWINQFQLSDTYRLIVPDLTGHGENETPTIPITLENMAIDVIELLDHIGVKSVVICGLSLGGLLAQEIYRGFPERVESLILSNTTFYIPSYFANKLVKNAEKFLHEHNKNELIKHIAEKSLYKQEFLQEAIESFKINDTYIEAAKSGIGYNYFPTLLKIVNKPVLLIGSSYDEICPLWNVFVFKWAIPFAEITILESGHLSNIECKDEFNQAIIKFIN